VTSDPRLLGLRPARARVDLDRLEANYRALCDFAGIPLMPVVKADAYGHGAVMIARQLEALGAPAFAVALVEEAIELRLAGIAAPLVVLNGLTASQAPLLWRHDLTPVLSGPAMLEAFLAGASASRPVHVKVDTGMGRLGFAPGELRAVCRRLADSGHAVQGVMTHLASADEDPAATARQLDCFDALLLELAHAGVRPRWVHAANSAGLAQLRPSHTLARPGLLLYGLPTRPLAPAVRVRPVLQVSADVQLIKVVPAGTPFGYGGRFVTTRPSRIATLPLGYADGVPRTDAMRERGRLLLHGQRVPVAGTVSMDMTQVDVTDVPEAREGDAAVLFGDEPTAWDVADWAGTNAWDTLTRVGLRVPRGYVRGERVIDVDSHYAPLEPA